MTTKIAADIARVPPLLAAWPATAWPELAEAITDQLLPPLLLVGEGSSRLFPAGLACDLARRWGLAGRLDQLGAREAGALDLGRWQVLLLSNSGETREVVELARALGRHPRVLALVGLPGNSLTRLVPRHRAVLDRPEGAVAATVSVVGQALTVAQAVAQAAGHAVPTAALAAAAKDIIAAPLPAAVIEALAGTRRLFWAGGENNAAGELATKSTEVPGLLGVHLPGTLLLHGIEEALTDGDTVVMLDPPAPDHAAIVRYLAQGTPAKLVSLATGPAPGAVWKLPDLGEWTPFIHLIAGWRVLVHLAEKLGRNPDQPRLARKVGNPLCD